MNIAKPVSAARHHTNGLLDVGSMAAVVAAPPDPSALTTYSPSVLPTSSDELSAAQATGAPVRATWVAVPDPAAMTYTPSGRATA